MQPAPAQGETVSWERGRVAAGNGFRAVCGGWAIVKKYKYESKMIYKYKIVSNRFCPGMAREPILSINFSLVNGFPIVGTMFDDSIAR